MSLRSQRMLCRVMQLGKTFVSWPTLFDTHRALNKSTRVFDETFDWNVVKCTRERLVISFMKWASQNSCRERYDYVAIFDPNIVDKIRRSHNIRSLKKYCVHGNDSMLNQVKQDSGSNKAQPHAPLRAVNLYKLLVLSCERLLRIIV
jgi:hypothetical protein